MHPDRALVGCDGQQARDLMERLYKPLALRGSQRTNNFAAQLHSFTFVHSICPFTHDALT